MESKLVNYLEPLIRNKYALIEPNPNIPLVEAMCRISEKDTKTFTLIVTDSINMYNLWTEAVGDSTELDVIMHSVLPHYIYNGFNLIIDFAIDTFTDVNIGHIKNCLPNWVWIINNSLGEKGLEIIGELDNNYKIITVEDNFDTENTNLFLLKRQLKDGFGTERLEYYTGIPIKKGEEDYTQFIPAFSHNQITTLSLTPREKYDFLIKRQEFYINKFKDKILQKRSMVQTSFLTKRCKECIVDIKSFMQPYRVKTVEKMLDNIYSNCILVIGDKFSEKIPFVSKDLAAIEQPEDFNLFMDGKLKVLNIDFIPHDKLLLYTSAIIINNLSTKTVDTINEINKLVDDIPIIIPYYENTKDDYLIDMIRNRFECKEISITDLEIVI